MSVNSTATPLCIPNSCTWNESTQTFSRDPNQPRSSLQAVAAALRKLRSIHTPVCVVSIAGPCRKGKSYIISRAFDQGNVFPLGHTMDPETTGIWMWVVPEKQRDAQGREYTIVLLDSEGLGAVGSESQDDHAVFTLPVLLSSVLIYNSMGVPTRTDLEGLDYIINLARRIQSFQGGSMDEECFRKMFPSFVWLLRDVVLSLPKDVANLREYFLDRVFRSGGHPSDKSKKIVDNILKFFPDFDAFPLSPPSEHPEVLQDLAQAATQGEVNDRFNKGVDDFKDVLKVKLSPKRSPTGEGLVSGEALATLVEEYIKAINTPGMVPCVKSTWDVFTQTKCTTTLESAKVVYDEIKELKCNGGLPCDDKRIRSSHLDNYLQALSFFESETTDISVTVRWPYMMKLMEYAEQVESELLIENNRLTNEYCSALMITLKRDILEPVLVLLWNREETDFNLLEARIRSAYQTVDSEFRKQAQGCRDLCSNLMVVFKEENDQEMKEKLDRLKLRKKYEEDIATLKKVREAEAEESDVIRRENTRLEAERKETEIQMEYLQEQQIRDLRELQRKSEKLMAMEREKMQAAMSAAREQSERERESYRQRQQHLQSEVDALRRRRDEQERTINELQSKLRRS